MTKLSLRYGNAEYSDEFLNSVLSDILNANKLMSIASIKDGQSYINTAFFCFNESLDIFFLSSPDAQHSLNIGSNNSIAISVFDSHQQWDNNKKGIQLFAKCELAKGLGILEGGKLYMQRFSGLGKWIKHIEDLMKNVIESKLYVARVHGLKVFDEDRLGKEIFLTLTPIRN